MEKYQVISVIGEGSFGKVMKARVKKTGEIVAIKIFKQTGMQNKFVLRTAMREKRCLDLLKQKKEEKGQDSLKYIVDYKEGFYHNNLLYLVFEYVDQSLLDALNGTTRGFSLETIRRYIYQLVRALAMVHDMGIIHRDIKLENLLIDPKSNTMKLCDFGSVAILGDYTESMLTEYVATRWYRAPEILVGATYGKAADIWALGCVFAEMTDSYPLFAGKTNLDMLKLIQNTLGNLPDDHVALFDINKRYAEFSFPKASKIDSLYQRYSNKLDSMALDFLEKCLEVNPEKRLTTKQAFAHPFLSHLHEQYLEIEAESSNHDIYVSEDKSLPPRQRALSPPAPAAKDTLDTSKDSELSLSQEYAHLLDMGKDDPVLSGSSNFTYASVLSPSKSSSGAPLLSSSSQKTYKTSGVKPKKKKPELVSVASWNVLPQTDPVFEENKKLKMENKQLKQDLVDLKAQLELMQKKLVLMEQKQASAESNHSGVCSIS
mmetsp:Transcript_11503/g.17034  ORF Transcript_11503/g.17034 Transcript_11503/m.17034 type:complete len:487 (+) Transcript_11503:61-1521(+)